MQLNINYGLINYVVTLDTILSFYPKKKKKITTE